MHVRKLSNRALLNAVAALVARDRSTTAELLQLLAEVDTRRLYLGAGHPSMFAWCTEALHMSESEAARRIHAARAVRRFPALLAPIAEGRLHLSAVCLLAPHFARDNFDALIAAATHRKKSEIEDWLAVRFAPPIVRAAAEAGPAAGLGGPAGASGSAEAGLADSGTGPTLLAQEPVVPQLAAAQASLADPVEHLPGDVDRSARTACTTPPGPAVAPHVVLHVALPPATHAKLLRAQRLLSHALPAGDVAAVLDRALDALIERVERRKFAAARKPRKSVPSRALAARTIPAAVKRAVVARDGERCAYVAPGGRRCSARSRLEFDHMDPVARGGLASADRVRLLCRAHNQFEAERVFGREFVRHKREERAMASISREMPMVSTSSATSTAEPERSG